RIGSIQIVKGILADGPGRRGEEIEILQNELGGAAGKRHPEQPALPFPREVQVAAELARDEPALRRKLHGLAAADRLLPDLHPARYVGGVVDPAPVARPARVHLVRGIARSEEHTSEL